MRKLTLLDKIIFWLIIRLCGNRIIMINVEVDSKKGVMINNRHHAALIQKCTFKNFGRAIKIKSEV